MNSDEVWCRAFLEAMGGIYANGAGGPEHDANATYCEKAADAALAVAQRRGMVTGERAVARPVTQADVAQVVSDYLSRSAPVAPVAPDQYWRLTTTGDVFRVRAVAAGVATLVKLAPLHSGDHLRRVTCAELQDGITWEREPEQAPQGERVEVWPVDFTAKRDGDMWTLHGWELGGAGIQVLAGRETYPMGAAVVHIRWAETMPPKPVKVWLEREGGA